MTPLARHVAELSARNRQWWKPYAELLAPFPGGLVKCFEMTQVRELASSLAEDAQKRNNVAEAMAFLPAPATWIEWLQPWKGEPAIHGYFLVQKEKTRASCVSLLGFETRGGIGFVPIRVADLPLLNDVDPDGWAIESVLQQQQLGNESAVPGMPRHDKSNVDWDAALLNEQAHAYYLYALLSMINSPRVVNRSQRPTPNKLAKLLGRKDGKPYELLPWHEIFLDISPPKETAEAGGDPHRLVGPKALHWCRQYLRIRLGKLELVRGHFRGDASVGVAQSRYVVGSRH